MKNKINWGVLIVLSLVGRFAFLGLRPFEGDEGIILKIAKMPGIKEFFAAVANDVHPPLYHLSEFLTLRAFPLNEFSARMISALSGLVAIYFIYLFFRKISNHQTAFSVALLSTINPVLTYHFAEARPYGLFVLVLFAELYYFLKVIEKETLKDLVIFTLLILALVLTQYMGFFILLGQLIYFLALKRKNKKAGKLAAAFVSMFLFLILWGGQFFAQMLGRLSEQSQALNLKANLVGLVNAFYRFFAGRLFLDLDPSISKNLSFMQNQPAMFVIFSLSILVTFLLLIWGMVNLYRNKRDNFWLIKLIFGPVLLAALFSSEIGPRSARYLLFLVPFVLYLIVELFNKKQSLFKTIIFTVFLAIYVASFTHSFYLERKKPGVNVFAEFLKSNAQEGENVVVQGGFGGGEEFVLKYYLKDFANELKIRDLYSDYKVGNLDEIKKRQATDVISDLPKPVWFYDMTYSFDKSKGLNPVEKFVLGKDKEGKDLVLYKF